MKVDSLNKHRLIGMEEVTVGTLNSALVHPRDVFGHLVRLSAAAERRSRGRARRTPRSPAACARPAR